MSQRHSSRRSVILLLRLALLAAAAGVWSGCASAKLAQEEIPKGKAIHIHMEGSRTKPNGPNPYKIKKVFPLSKGICREHETEDCKPTVSWQIKSKALPSGWYVMVQLKADATKKCFARAPFKIAGASEVDSGDVDASVCNRWDTWPYDVVLFDGSGTEKGRMDPLLVINH